MSIMKAVLALLALVTVSFSLDITISGKVTDTGTTALSGAAVKLEKYGLTAMTGADGAFTITGTVGINNISSKIPDNKLSASTGNGVLYLHLLERGAVEIITYTLQGKAVSRLQKVMDIGAHSIAQPEIGNGVYLYRIKACGSELIVKSPTLGRIAGGVLLSTQGITTTATASRVERYAPINDVIAVTKDGYLNYRVIVTNSDTSGIEIKMIVCAGTVTDADGNVYQTVKIGNQEWMAENLRTTKYNDGTLVTLDTSTSTWADATTEKYCYYNNTTTAESINKYGALYNWYVVNPSNPKKIAPAGWHVPTDSEWTILEKYLVINGYNWDGTTDTTGYNKISKSLAAKTDWYLSTAAGVIGNDLRANNKSGFSALPGGYRDAAGYFFYQSGLGTWWSATEDDATLAWYRNLGYGSDDLGRDRNYKSCGFSVRLLRD